MKYKTATPVMLPTSIALRISHKFKGVIQITRLKCSMPDFTTMNDDRMYTYDIVCHDKIIVNALQLLLPKYNLNFIAHD